MVKYKCGHKTDGVIIMDSNELGMANYLIWLDSVGMNGTKGQCFECYCSHNLRKGNLKGERMKNETLNKILAILFFFWGLDCAMLMEILKWT